uniref:Uncharacterized protein n=1 Tax=Arundo donax TaxID=35708 RepID=A0A0A9HN83_ARUDO
MKVASNQSLLNSVKVGYVFFPVLFSF